MYSLRTIRIARVILACVALGMIALIVWLGWSVYTDYFKTAPRQPVDTADVKKEYVVKKFNHNITSYGRFFNDLQELQVAEAMANGVGPLCEADIPDAVAAGRLVKIEDSDTYYLISTMCRFHILRLPPPTCSPKSGRCIMNTPAATTACASPVAIARRIS